MNSFLQKWRLIYLLIVFSSTISFLNAQTVNVWITKGDQSVKLQQQSSLTFGTNGTNPNYCNHK